MDRRKLPSFALFLTTVGALLMLPPLVLLFDGPVRLFGIPAEVIYLFAVWVALIVGTAVVSARLPRTAAPVDEGEHER